MKVGKALRPFKAVVSSDGTRTNFSVQENKLNKQTNTWEKGKWFTVSVEGLNFPISEKNPDGYKIVPKKIEGVTVGEFNGNTTITIWLADLEIQDKEGNTIIDSITKAAKYMGEKVNGNAEEIPSGFAKLNDEDLPF